jgi:hypothetical protein
MNELVVPIREALEEIVRRGIERGELRQDLDLEVATDLMHGTVVYRVLIGHELVEASSTLPKVLELLRA